MKAVRKKRKTKYVIVNKVKFTFSCTLMILTAIMIVNIVMGITSAIANKNSETITIYASAGDTLWGIAAKNNPLDKDVRDVVDDIIKLSGLESSDIKAGERLVIPVY